MKSEKCVRTLLMVLSHTQEIPTETTVQIPLPALLDTHENHLSPHQEKLWQRPEPPSMKGKTLLIPVDKLPEGCDLSLDNAIAFAQEAILLLRNGHTQHAYALVILGFQELGKFGELLESYVDAFETEASAVTVKGFFDHRFKMDARMKHYRASEKQERKELEGRRLPTYVLTKQEKHWMRIFDSKEFANSVKELERDGESERLAATYVDFDVTGNQWIAPRSPTRRIVVAHVRLLMAEASSLKLMFSMKPPWVALMAWKAEGLQ